MVSGGLESQRAARAQRQRAAGEATGGAVSSRARCPAVAAAWAKSALPRYALRRASRNAVQACPTCCPTFAASRRLSPTSSPRFALSRSSAAFSSASRCRAASIAKALSLWRRSRSLRRHPAAATVPAATAARCASAARWASSPAATSAARRLALASRRSRWVLSAPSSRLKLETSESVRCCSSTALSGESDARSDRSSERVDDEVAVVSAHVEKNRSPAPCEAICRRDSALRTATSAARDVFSCAIARSRSSHADSSAAIFRACRRCSRRAAAATSAELDVESVEVGGWWVGSGGGRGVLASCATHAIVRTMLLKPAPSSPWTPFLCTFVRGVSGGRFVFPRTHPLNSFPLCGPPETPPRATQGHQAQPPAGARLPLEIRSVPRCGSERRHRPDRNRGRLGGVEAPARRVGRQSPLHARGSPSLWLQWTLHARLAVRRPAAVGSVHTAATLRAQHPPSTPGRSPGTRRSTGAAAPPA
eukprot:m.9255 g.9255  ORF g.9255 m.9255 type:complete len:478 (+) comp4157_c0_seq2:106-1539(+)